MYNLYYFLLLHKGFPTHPNQLLHPLHFPEFFSKNSFYLPLYAGDRANYPEKRFQYPGDGNQE